MCMYADMQVSLRNRETLPGTDFPTDWDAGSIRRESRARMLQPARWPSATAPCRETQAVP